MKERLLQYEFWETADKYYSKLFERILGPNLLNIRKYIAKTLFSKFDYSKDIVWLDVGSGDGATLEAIFKVIPNFRKRKIKLIVIEPSPKAIRVLKSKLKKYYNVSLKIINKKFNSSLLKREKYDIITFLHSSYYIANSKKGFEKTYLKAYDSIKKGGILLVQSIKSDGDFRKLEKPPRAYHIFACGDKTFEIFKKFWENSIGKELITNFNATPYLSKNPSKERLLEIKHYYQFIHQNPNLKFSDKEKRNFLNKIKRLAKYKNKKYLLNYKDWVASVKKI